MGLSTNTFTYEGGDRTFILSLSLGYLKEDDIAVYVVGEFDTEGDQVYRAFTFDSEFVIRVTDALENGDEVTAERTVSKTVLEADFETGGDVTPRNMMLLHRQLMMALQELLDGRIEALDIAALLAAAEAIDINTLVKRNGSTPFTGPQGGVDPTTGAHLATKDYVDLQSATGAGDIKADGTVPMLAPLDLVAGAPEDPEHATRKDYVDAQVATKTNEGYVDSAVAGLAPLASPALTGIPTGPTASPGDNSEQLATTEYVDASGGGFEGSLLHVRDEKSSGSPAGSFSAGSPRTRVLNTVFTNEIAGAGLASNKITGLPTGEYYCVARGQAYNCGAHVISLYNDTQSVTLIGGENARAKNGNDPTTHSFLEGRFSHNFGDDLKLRHECKITGDFGISMGFGEVEVFANVMIWKVG